jgi:hypothetical protein
MHVVRAIPRMGLVGLVAAGLLTFACTPAPSTTLRVINESDATLFVQLHGPPGVSYLTFRVDPGADGRAVGPGNDVPVARLVVYDTDCAVLLDETDPVLGRLEIDAAGTVVTDEQSRRDNIVPVLPVEEACRP